MKNFLSVYGNEYYKWNLYLFFPDIFLFDELSHVFRLYLFEEICKMEVVEISFIPTIFRHLFKLLFWIFISLMSLAIFFQPQYREFSLKRMINASINSVIKKYLNYCSFLHGGNFHMLLCIASKRRRMGIVSVYGNPSVIVM